MICIGPIPTYSSALPMKSVTFQVLLDVLFAVATFVHKNYNKPKYGNLQA